LNRGWRFCRLFDRGSFTASSTSAGARSLGVAGRRASASGEREPTPAGPSSPSSVRSGLRVPRMRAHSAARTRPSAGRVCQRLPLPRFATKGATRRCDSHHLATTANHSRRKVPARHGKSQHLRASHARGHRFESCSAHHCNCLHAGYLSRNRPQYSDAVSDLRTVWGRFLWRPSIEEFLTNPPPLSRRRVDRPCALFRSW
jgi:hypothetical protein